MLFCPDDFDSAGEVTDTVLYLVSNLSSLLNANKERQSSADFIVLSHK